MERLESLILKISEYVYEGHSLGVSRRKAFKEYGLQMKLEDDVKKMESYKQLKNKYLTSMKIDRMWVKREKD